MTTTTLSLSTDERATLAEKARMVRTEVVRLTEIAGSGHYGSAFSIAELLVALYYKLLRVRPNAPQWADRDRFTMGKGHAAIAVYPILADLGFFPASDLDTYTRLGSPLGDHPDMRKVKGADFSSGSIGHNLSVSVGMALALRLRKSPARVVCMLGDGEQGEGQIWEAAASAGYRKLSNLVAIVDRNEVESDDRCDAILDMEPLDAKYRAFGWDVVHLRDGHDLQAVTAALDDALNGWHDKPVVVLADTIAGKGVSFMEHAWQWHLGYLGPRDYERAMKELEA
ncbi:transketolase [Vulcanimicrobium alpinum]|uniref:Transketolase n=1 Tax=Vulcanimicrobium alpinum TaxID=3016050 RepID=A0AAN2C915_UNVUL|nr:transketolase [Vulcanimicrobium alpinum]BDE05849.1 transketolase [Vulcanimicrobium alpinum]